MNSYRPMKIVLNPTEKHLESFIRSVPDIFYLEGKTIHKLRNEIKVFEVNGEKINVKRFKVPHFINRIAYRFFRLSKAERSYRYALKLKSNGIETPYPIGYILVNKNWMLQETYYISKQVNYDRNMYEFGKGGIKGREHIIQALARFTALLHEQGIYHNDYSPGNILFKENRKQVSFCLVDINRMYFGKISIKKGCANLARLWGQKELFIYLAKEYADARKADEEECLRWILRYHNKFWRRYAKKRPVPFELDSIKERY